MDIVSRYTVEQLPDIDQQRIKRGRCPWCLGKLIPGGIVSEDANDSCHECRDEFIGALSDGLD